MSDTRLVLLVATGVGIGTTFGMFACAMMFKAMGY